MSRIGRREFLQLAGAGALVSVTGCNFVSRLFTPSLDSLKIISGYRYGEPYTTTDAGLSIITPTSNFRIKLDNEIHAVIHSAKFDLKVMISKLELYSYYQFGNGDIHRIQADEGNYFYGHARIDEKRKLVYFSQARITETRSEFDRREEAGFIYAYSIPDFKLVDKFTSYGSDPHDLLILDNTLVVCNGGANSNVTFIDLDTKKLLRDFKVNQDHLSLRHIEMIDKENFVIIPLTRDLNKPCPPYSLNTQTGLSAFPMPYMLEMAMFRHQILSGLFHDGYFYGTCPAMNNVSVWTSKGEFVGGVEIPFASNLGYSRALGGIIVGCGEKNEHARLVKVVDGNVTFESIPWATEVMGSHSLILEG